MGVVAAMTTASYIAPRLGLAAASAFSYDDAKAMKATKAMKKAGNVKPAMKAMKALKAVNAVTIACARWCPHAAMS
jgi:hypothetical protein